MIINVNYETDSDSILKYRVFVVATDASGAEKSYIFKFADFPTKDEIQIEIDKFEQMILQNQLISEQQNQ